MSVTSLLSDPTVVGMLSSVAPTFPAEIPARLRVVPGSREYALIGQAVDYAIRFELQRRNPHAIQFPWVAARAVDSTLPVIAPELVAPATRVLADATSLVSLYAKLERPTPEQRRALSATCLQLAKIESIYRQGKPRPDFDEWDEDAAVDVLRILAVTPFKEIERGQPMLLNPTFGAASQLVGNADADLIVGDLLVDFKTTARQEITQEYVLQLLSYLILARHARNLGLQFPEIRRVGILFTRHGSLIVSDVSELCATPAFAQAEAAYLAYAARKFPQSSSRAPQ